MKTKYVLGFLFSEDESKVALIKKKRPDWQKGFLNGIGGKLKGKGFWYYSMVEEFREETGVLITKWQPVIKLIGDDYEVIVYRGFSNSIYDIESPTDEIVEIVKICDIPKLKVIENVKWMIPLCLDGQLNPWVKVDYTDDDE
jgi:8-oxo-dGTP pyrophosphatase MutT (NUDIX family)